MAAIYAYISSIWAGIENPLWPHLLLVPSAAIAGLAVGAGIFFERPKYSGAVHKVAIWLVLVGVGIEAVCTVLLFVVDERISSRQEAELVVASRTARVARSHAAEAEQQATVAIAKAAALEKEAAAQNARAAELEKEAANAKLEQERLKQLVQWRTINPADLTAFIAELTNGSGEIDLAYIPSDPESEYFALGVIGNAFKAVNKASGTPKWHVYLHAWYSNGAMYFGIAIPGAENEQVRVLRRAFSAAHIEFSTEKPPDETSPVTLGTGLNWTPPPKHDAFILVGLRNPPP